MRQIPPVLGASFGLLACVSFISLYIVAVSIDHEYTFFENYLSDLGVGPGAWAFNSAVISAGVLIILFSASGLRQLLPKDRPSTAGEGLLVVAGLFLVGIGVFTEDYGDLHTFVSVAFFTMLEIGIGVLSAALYRSKALGQTGWMASLIVFVLGVGVVMMGMGPESETVAVLLALVWGSSLSSAAIWLESGHRIP